MLKSVRLLSVIVITTCFVACKKDNSNNSMPISIPVDTAGSAIQIDSLPLKVGYSWTYESQQQNQTKGINLYSAIQTGNVTLTIVSDTFVNGFHLYKLSANSYFGAYYVSTPNGLYTLDNIAEADSMYINDTAMMIAKYPVNINDTWPSKGGAGVHAGIWSGYEKVNVPAGSFNCIEADVYAGYGNISTRYYFTAKGAVRLVKQLKGNVAGPDQETISVSILNLQSVNF